MTPPSEQCLTWSVWLFSLQKSKLILMQNVMVASCVSSRTSHLALASYNPPNISKSQMSKLDNYFVIGEKNQFAVSSAIDV